MPTDAEITFADHAGRLYARRYGMAPMVGRLLGYLAICDPRQQSIAELADALLASRSAIANAANALDTLGLIRRSRAAGERMDRIQIDMNAPRSTGFDVTEYQEQAALAREGLALLADAPPERKAVLLEWAAFADFLVARLALLRLVSPRHGELGDSRLALDHQRELVKRDRHAPGHRRLDRQLVMPSTNVLDQGVAGDHDPGAAVLLEPAHRTKSCLQAAVVGLNPVVGVLLGVVPRRRQQLLQDDRVGRRLIGHDLAWHGPRRADSPLEESTGRPQIAPWRDEHVDDLPELIDRTIDIAPAASHLHIGLVCLPAVPDRVPAGPGRLAQ
jgi:hypothetical protein